jgi:hypothetical protein
MVSKFLFARFFLLFFSFCCVGINAQETDSIVKITVSYITGGNSWGKPGIYSRGNYLELVPDGNGDFVYSVYMKKWASAGDDGNTFTNDSVVLSVNKLKTLPRQKIYSLVNELSADRNNFTTDFLVPRLARPTKKQMMEVAAASDDAEYFELNEYNERGDIRRLVNEIRSFKKFEDYIKDTSVASHESVMLIDAFDMMRISIYSKNSMLIFDSQYFKPLGQPIEKYPKANFLHKTTAINLMVNIILREILPKDSMLHEVVDLNAVTNDYIKWYLHNRFD